MACGPREWTEQPERPVSLLDWISVRCDLLNAAEGRRTDVDLSSASSEWAVYALVVVVQVGERDGGARSSRLRSPGTFCCNAVTDLGVVLVLRSRPVADASSHIGPALSVSSAPIVDACMQASRDQERSESSSAGCSVGSLRTRRRFELPRSPESSQKRHSRRQRKQKEAGTLHSLPSFSLGRPTVYERGIALRLWSILAEALTSSTDSL